MHKPLNIRAGRDVAVVALLVAVVCASISMLQLLGADRADAIVGGEAATTNEYPWMVKLEDCSGTLIAPDWVLTASHCIEAGQTNAVWIGGLRWGDGERRYWNRKVELAPFATGDQTLLHLSSPSTKQTLAYNGTTNFGNVGPATAVGYGESCATCSDANLRSVANLVAVDSGNGFITTGVAGSNRTICRGDSGGPLVKKHNGRWVQVAVHSYTIRPDCTGLAGHTSTAQFAAAVERTTGVAPVRPAPAANDTQRPSPPQGLKVSGNQPVLQWNASTDNVAVAHYTVHRSTNGTLGPQIAQTLSTTFTDRSAQPGTVYTYAIKARDTSGNLSWRSNLARTSTSPGGGVGSASCTKQQAATGVKITVTGMSADRYAIRTSGQWLVSLDRRTTSYTHQGGALDAHYVVRYYAPNRTDIVCTRASSAACAVSARNNGVQVSVANIPSDRYAVRVNGAWISSVDNPGPGHFHAGGSTADRYVVRYYKPNRIDLVCSR